MVERSDALLIEASLKDPARFGDLFDRHVAEIRGYLHRRVGAATGDDLTSETFAIAFRGRERYDRSRHDARPWLFGIAANTIRNHRRSERRQARAYARSAPEVDSSLDDAAVHARADAASFSPRVYEALASLRRDDRELLLLHAWADLSHREIAEALELPIGTVKSRLSRSLEKVRAALEISAPGPGEPDGTFDAGEKGGSG